MHYDYLVFDIYHKSPMVIKFPTIQRVSVDFYKNCSKTISLSQFIRDQTEIAKDKDFRYATIDAKYLFFQRIFYIV
jgi:hypothetical protein